MLNNGVNNHQPFLQLYTLIYLYICIKNIRYQILFQKHADHQTKLQLIIMFTGLESRMSSTENELEELKKENAGKLHNP